MADFMKCGHSAQARDSKGRPACAICIGTHPGATVVEGSPPSLEGRFATCSYSRRRDGKPCTSRRPSSFDLPFFEHRPRNDTDEYYCGCWGWD